MSLRRPRVTIALFSALALVLSGVLPATSASAQTVPVPLGARFVPNEVILQFKPGVSEAQKADARSRANAVHKEQVRALAAGDLEVAALPPGLVVATAVGALQNHPAVAFAEPNWIYEHQATSNDPYYTTNGLLWGMYGDDPLITPGIPTNQYGSQAEEAWVSNTGSNSNTVYVCVIDEGIQLDHEDLGLNVDTANSRSFVGDNTGPLYDPMFDDHGTHVAGTIGAIGGNAKGVAGVSWSVKLISAKFLGPIGGTTADAIEAVDYCTKRKTEQGLNVVASNNSWGGGGYSQALHDAIIRAAKADILFVAAAGNGNLLGLAQNNDTRTNYPSNFDTSVGTSTETKADYDAVIAVAAIDQNGSKASWSNYGAKTVDMGAPGVDIYSTLPGHTYGSYSGTSMAAPHVTGGVALYKSANPSASASMTKEAILGAARATPTSSLARITVTGGRLNVSSFR